jgi:hypothetical protein
MAVLASNQAFETQLGKASAPGGNPRREHICHRHLDCLNDLLFVECFEVAVFRAFARL